jgi:hypothetical protein
MQQSFPPDTLRPDAKLFSVLVANSVPIAGLFVFDMSAAALLVFYWLELGVLMIWAIIRALFAGKPPGKEAEREPFSGSQWATLRVILSSKFFNNGDEDSTSNDGSWRDLQIPIPRTDVGIYFGTIPALVVVIFLFSFVWAGFGGVVAGPVVAAADMTNTPIWPLTGAGVVFLSEGTQTIREYFYHGGYRETSVWTAARGIFYKGFALAGAGFLVLMIVYESIEAEAVSLESAASGPLIVTAIGSKFLIDLTTYYIDGRNQPLRNLIFPE